ncbi:unnamed protein product [Spodoptera littoralis]|uniref:Carboxylesterase type B domain-containing protein n=1 Tax=Spodoptera littoralis TaxID=7109 RepID=A0A9P0I1X1_SPOLI|nr:unnamed protein product [Spodoptera littoralis]CAH1637981.1 unnamed protein product [Spodoptera littoralis]
MKNFMTDLFVQFMSCSKPICDDKRSLWPENNGDQIEVIEAPGVLRTNSRSMRQLEVVDFFDNLPSRVNVVLAQGRLRGITKDGYVSYTGIPYASITGTLGRFKRAGIAPLWSDIRNSRSPTCSLVSDAEHCLQLDVHVPSVVGGNWPVLVWVTGGSGPYSPGRMVQEGIIVVIVHHRLGPSGFLCLRDENIPGNAGVKDAVLALRWVRDNIVAFKGNPAKVVVAGQSFGAAMVEAVLLSNMASGLYHGAILQSGSALCPWSFNFD